MSVLIHWLKRQSPAAALQFLTQQSLWSEFTWLFTLCKFSPAHFTGGVLWPQKVMESLLVVLLMDHRLTSCSPLQSLSLEGRAFTLIHQWNYCVLSVDTSSCTCTQLQKSIMICKPLISKKPCNISEITLPSISGRSPSFIYYTPPCLIRLLFKSEVPYLNIGATWRWKGARSPHARAQIHALNPCGQAKVLQLICTVTPGEILRISTVPPCWPWACVKAGFVAMRAASVFTGACMVSGLAAVKQRRDGEGALLLSEGLRQTVTHQPKDCLLLTARVTRYNKRRAKKLLFFLATLLWLCTSWVGKKTTFLTYTSTRT